MYRIHMLPALFGDCLWVDYGDAPDPKVMLIDAGTAGTWKSLRRKIVDRIQMSGKRLRIELFVVTHVDRDHIGGAVKFLEELGTLDVEIGEVWFNGWHHLNESSPPLHKDQLGPKDGEQLSALLLEAGIPWNSRFHRSAVVVPESGELPVFAFDGLTITLLSPDQKKLDALVPVWMDEVTEANLIPGEAYVIARSDALGTPSVETLAALDFEMDGAPANGSSIAFLARHGETTVLFGADAHPDILLRSLARVESSQLAGGIAALKMSHHGSKANTSSDLLEILDAEHYLVSTNGSVFGHPDQEAIARVLVQGGKAKFLHFNYRVATTEPWALEGADFHCTAHYGTDVDGLVVDL
jgi:hypothetical protein